MLLLFFSWMFQATLAETPQIEFGPVPAWVQPYPLDPSAKPASDRHYEGLADLLVEYQEEAAAGDMFIRRMYRIENVSGLQHGAQLMMDFDPLHQQLVIHKAVIHRQGQTIEAVRQQDWKLIQQESELDRFMYNGNFSAVGFLDGLQVGDVVEFAWTIQQRKTKFGEKYWSKFRLNYTFSLNVFHIRIVAPTEMALRIKSGIPSFQPEKRTTDGITSYRWLAGPEGSQEIPAWDPDEEKDPAFLTLSAYKNWFEVVNQLSPYYELPKDSLWLNDWLQATKKRYPALEDQVLEAIRFVQDDIRYLGIEMGSSSHIPTSPEETFKRRFGDCKDKTQLLCQMLGQLGVSAEAVLVHSERGAKLSDELPSPFVFDHVVTVLDWQGEKMAIDATVSHQRGRIRDRSGLPFVKGLALNHRDRDLMNIPNQAGSSSVEIERQFRLEAWGDAAELRIKTKFHGVLANQQREELTSASQRVVSEHYLEFRKAEFAKLELIKPIEIVDASRENTLTIVESYRVPDYGDHEEEQAYFVVQGNAILQYLGWPSGNDSKWAPAYPLTLDLHYEVVLPDPWPYSGQKTKIDNDVFSFEYKSSRKGGRHYVFDWSFRSLRAHVTGVSEEHYLEDLALLRSSNHGVLSAWGGDGQGFGKAFMQWQAWRLDTLVSLFLFGGAFWFYTRVYRSYRRKEWAHWQQEGGRS